MKHERAAVPDELSRDAILYHAIQRVYRPAVLDHIRVRMTEVYGERATAKLKSHFGPEIWAHNEGEATRSRAAGILKGTPRDAFDLLDVTNLHVVLGGEFDVLFPAPSSGEPKEARNERRNAIVAWARVVRSARNPMAHPIADEVEVADALGCIASARMVASLINPATERDLAGLMDDLSHRDHSVDAGSLFISALPPAETICPQFVGREEYLSRLVGWLENLDKRRHLLAGSGGKGKTAIAYELARRVRQAPVADISAIVWLSAKRRAFADGDVRDLPHTDFTNLEQALGYLLRALGRADATLEDPESRRRTALDALRSRTCLVVVDDVDTIGSSEESVHEFFLEASFTTPSKFLFTSRRGMHGMGGATTIVTGLSEAEGMSFIASRAELYALPTALFTEDRCRAVLEATEGTPLYIDDLLRLVASGMPADEAVESWKEHRGERARAYALRREFEQLSRDGRRVLVAASLPDQGASVAELRAITDLDEDGVASAVSELTEMFFVSRRLLTDGNEVLQLETNARTLIRTVAEQDYPDDLRRLAAARQSVVGARPGRRGPVGRFIAQASFLAKAKRWAEAERALADGLEAYPEHPDLLSELGRHYLRASPPRISDARRCFGRAHELGYRDPQMLRRWVRMEIEAGQLSVAVRVANAAIASVPSDQALLHLAAWAHWRRGRELATEGSSEAREAMGSAEQLLESALSTESAGASPTAFDRSASYASLAGVLKDSLVLEEPGQRADGISGRLLRVLADWRAEFPEDGRIALYEDVDTPRSQNDSRQMVKSLEVGKAKIPQSRPSVRVGVLVSHRTFGHGTVLRVSGQPQHQVAEINFDKFGPRRVMADALSPVETELPTGRVGLGHQQDRRSK